MTQNSITATPGGGTTFQGPEAIKVYQLTAIKSSLAFYAKTGGKVNVRWRLSKVLEIVSKETGKTYAASRLGAEKAVADLQGAINARLANIRA